MAWLPRPLVRPAVTTSTLTAVLLAGTFLLAKRPTRAVTQLIEPVSIANLNERDRDLLDRSYYERINAFERVDSRVWDLAAAMPPNWNWLDSPERIQEVHDLRRFVPTAGLDTEFKGARLTTNRWGMRDRDYEASKPPGTVRLALLGASADMGSGVSDAETYEALLEQRLNKEGLSPADEQVEILNFSVPSYGPLQKLEHLQAAVVAFEPDILLYSAFQNEDNWLFVLGQALNDAIPIGDPFLAEIAERAGLVPGLTEPQIRLQLRPYRRMILFWTYERIVQVCRQHAIEPVWFMLARDQDPQLRRLASSAGFRVLDLPELYAGYPDSALARAAWDAHPNALAHELIADRLASAIKQSDLLGKPTMQSKTGR